LLLLDLGLDQHKSILQRNKGKGQVEWTPYGKSSPIHYAVI